jgi:hypothetical protein
VQFNLIAAGAPPFAIGLDGSLYGPNNEPHSLYPTFEAFVEAMMLRSTQILWQIDLVRNTFTPVADAFLSRAEDWPNPQLDYAHTLETSSVETYVCVEDTFYRIDSLTIAGVLGWQYRPPLYRVMEKVPTGEAFAGAIIGQSNVPGKMFAMILSDGSRDIHVNSVQLEQKHLNSIRDLELLCWSRSA